MKHGKWDCSENGCQASTRAVTLRWLIALFFALLSLGSGVAKAQGAQPAAPTQAQIIVTDSAEPPAASDPRWRTVPLAQDEPGTLAWYRVHFDGPAPAAAEEGPAMLYLPYFYGGGRVMLNGTLVADVPHTTATRSVRWERPMLLPLTGATLKAQGNELLIQAHTEKGGSRTVLPSLLVGTERALRPMFERRNFFVRTVPTLTWAAGSVVGLLVLLIWLQRRKEVLYGLFGLAALLGAQRTTTFVLETMSTGAWEAWRIAYHLCTGGFVVVIALSVLVLAGWARKGLTRGLIGYWALGPVMFLLLGEKITSQLWASGLAIIGLGMTVAAVAAAWRRRSADTIAMAFAVTVSFAAGFHDQLLATRSSWITEGLPNWSNHHLFLLHHSSNVMLLVLGTLLSRRFVRSLNAVEAANRTLQIRLKQREEEVAQSYQRIAALQREQATTEERHRIMRDLHDGLGSQLFTSLMQAERGVMQSADMADSLRSAIDQMRVTLEALSLEEQDFEAAFGNFRFRWDARLRDAGLQPRWDIRSEDTAAEASPPLAPHDTLQVLHIIQEALTNVLKHAQATEVKVRLVLQPDALTVDIEDNGSAGAASVAASSETKTAPSAGRGRSNMNNRAQRLGGRLEWQALTPGTRVHLWAPRRPHAAQDLASSASS